MAKGRMLDKEICTDKRVNKELSGPWSMLGYTWLIPHMDCEGRTHGDPSVVKSMIFPRQDGVTVSDVEKYIREWAACGMILWYVVDGDQYIQFVNYQAHQTIRKDREAPSIIPAPGGVDWGIYYAAFPSKDAQINSGVTQELVSASLISDAEENPVKLNELKLKEKNLSESKEDKPIFPIPMKASDWVSSDPGFVIMPERALDAWNQMMGEVERTTSRAIWESYVKSVRLVKYEGHSVLVEMINGYTADVLVEKGIIKKMQSLMAGYLNDPELKIEFEKKTSTTYFANKEKTHGK